MSEKIKFSEVLADQVRRRILDSDAPVSIRRAAEQAGIPTATMNSVYQGAASPSPATAARIAEWLSRPPRPR